MLNSNLFVVFFLFFLPFLMFYIPQKSYNINLSRAVLMWTGTMLTMMTTVIKAFWHQCALCVNCAKIDVTQAGNTAVSLVYLCNLFFFHSLWKFTTKKKCICRIYLWKNIGKREYNEANSICGHWAQSLTLILVKMINDSFRRMRK